MAGAAASAGGQGFGQNQVIIRDFDWKVRATEHFDIYYYEGSEPRVPEAARVLEEAFARATKALDIPVEAPSWASPKQKKRLRWERRPFFLYASPNDFQQSSIAQVGDGTGGVTEPFKNRFMVYNDGTSQWLDEVTTHEFIHILQFHVLIAGFWRTGSILKSIVYPLWMMEGMPGALTHGIEPVIEEMTIRDAATSGGLIPLTRLEHFGHLKPHQIVLAYKQGAAAMEFLRRQFGARTPGEMLKLFRDRFESGQVLSELVGLDLWEFDDKYREYLETKYRRQARKNGLREPGVFGGALTRTPDDLPQFNTSPVFSPDGRRMYYLSTAGGHPSEIRELDLATGRRRSLASVGPARIENIPMGNFANLSRVLDLSPDGRRLVFAATRNHEDAIFIYDLETGRLERRPVKDFQTVSQPRFSPDGKRIAFSGMKDSYTDLYLYDVAAGAVEQLTDDARDDEMPAFTPDGRALVYSAETEGPGGSYERRLFRLDLKDRSITGLEEAGGQARDPVVSADGGKVLFALVRDESSEVAELDLATGRVTRLTRSVGGAFAPVYAPGGELAFAALRGGSVHIHKGPRSDFLGEVLASGAAAAEVPSPREVAASTAAVALGPQRPYQFSYSTDLFIPAFFYSSVGGFFWTSYWQGSDLLGIHQNAAAVSFQSGRAFDYGARYSYSRYRPQIVLGADGFGRRDLIDVDTGAEYSDYVHSQFAAVRYPLDRYHRLEGVVSSVTESANEPAFGIRERREARAVGAAAVRDTVRGRYLVATEGGRLRVSYSQLIEAAGGNQRYYTAGAEAHRFVSTGGQTALAFRAAGYQTLGPDHPQLILGGLGGARGYGRSTTQDFGSRLGVVNAEWRFPVLSNLNYHMWYFFPDFYFKAVFGTLFADTAYAWNDDGQAARARWRDLRQSAGLGLRIYTFILQEFPLVISMDYARRTTQNGGIFYVYLGQLF